MMDRLLDWCLDQGARVCVVLFAILALVTMTAAALGAVHAVLREYGVVGGCVG